MTTKESAGQRHNARFNDVMSHGGRPRTPTTTTSCLDSSYYSCVVFLRACDEGSEPLFTWQPRLSHMWNVSTSNTLKLRSVSSFGCQNTACMSVCCFKQHMFPEDPRATIGKRLQCLLVAPIHRRRRRRPGNWKQILEEELQSLWIRSSLIHSSIHRRKSCSYAA